MTDTEFHTLPWALTLAFGLPTLAVAAWKRWTHAQAAFRWRFAVCVLAACIIAPAVVIEDFGGVTTVDVFPAVMVLALGTVGLFTGETNTVKDGAAYGLLPILVMSLVIVFLWSLIVGGWSLIAKSRKIGTG